MAPGFSLLYKLLNNLIAVRRLALVPLARAHLSSPPTFFLSPLRSILFLYPLFPSSVHSPCLSVHTSSFVSRYLYLCRPSLRTESPLPLSLALFLLLSHTILTTVSVIYHPQFCRFSLSSFLPSLLGLCSHPWTGTISFVFSYIFIVLPDCPLLVFCY